MARAGQKHTVAAQQSKCRPPKRQIVVFSEGPYLDGGKDVDELAGRTDFVDRALRRQRKERLHDLISTRYDKTPLRERAWDKVLDVADEYARLPGTTTIDNEKHNSIVDRLYRAIYQSEFKDKDCKYLDPSPLASTRLDLSNRLSFNDFRKLFKIEYLLLRRKEVMEWFFRNNIDFPKTLLPSAPDQRPEDRAGSGAWIATEARRMKADDEIPQGIKITDFARALAKQMDNAAKVDASIRPIKWRSIKNKLRDWGLWPIDSI